MSHRLGNLPEVATVRSWSSDSGGPPLFCFQRSGRFWSWGSEAEASLRLRTPFCRAAQKWPPGQNQRLLQWNSQSLTMQSQGMGLTSGPLRLCFFAFFFFLILAALGCHCVALAFSNCSARRLLSSCSPPASHCAGFSQQSTGSGV